MASQDQEQNSSYLALRNIIHAIKNSIYVAELCKVVKYDKKKHIADVLPLANSSDGEPSPQLLEVPVAKSCYEVDELTTALKDEFKKIDKFQTEKGRKIGTGLVKKLPKKVMKKGAVVIVLIVDNDTDNWTGKNASFTPETNRLHDINDAIIVGVI